jgi:poly-gamma-glutamate capsule biosynthesis protein CapA/YwtB (metallophosphatase superfamily)
VIRGIERYRHRLIAYSLGNFVGYHTLQGGGVLSESAILRVTLGPGGRVLRGRWISIRLQGGLPRRDPANASARLVRALSREDFGAARFTIAPDGGISPPAPRRHRVGRHGAHLW